MTMARVDIQIGLRVRMTRPAHQTAFRPERRMMPGELGRQADELSIRTDSNPTSSHLEEFEHVASPLQINHIFNLVCFLSDPSPIIELPCQSQSLQLGQSTVGHI